MSMWRSPQGEKQSAMLLLVSASFCTFLQDAVALIKLARNQELEYRNWGSPTTRKKASSTRRQVENSEGCLPPQASLPSGLQAGVLHIVGRRSMG